MTQSFGGIEFNISHIERKVDQWQTHLKKSRSLNTKRPVCKILKQCACQGFMQEAFQSRVQHLKAVSVLFSSGADPGLGLAGTYRVEQESATRA